MFTPALQENPSRFPTYNEYGGGLKEDEPGDPPPSPDMPKASEHNQMSGALDAWAATARKFILQLAHSGGTYSVVDFACINNTLTATNVTFAPNVSGAVVVTKNGTGDLTIQFAVGKIPALRFPPQVQFNHSTASTRTSETQLVDGRTVRVRMFNSGGASEALCTIRCE